VAAQRATMRVHIAHLLLYALLLVMVAHARRGRRLQDAKRFGSVCRTKYIPKKKRALSNFEVLGVVVFLKLHYRRSEEV
jgi:hypothetical protein